LKERADLFLKVALPKLGEVVKDLEITDSAYMEQQYEGKTIIEVLFAGAYRQHPAVFIRGAILKRGALEPEVISVPFDRVAVFAGVNDKIGAYIKGHPNWKNDGVIRTVNRLIGIEATSHPDLVGLPVSIGTVDASGEFHWLQRGECGEKSVGRNR
jgi:hypothetical protein